MTLKEGETTVTDSYQTTCTYFLPFSSSYLAKNSIGVVDDSAIFLLA
jgi:hypothetical protein